MTDEQTPQKGKRAFKNPEAKPAKDRKPQKRSAPGSEVDNVIRLPERGLDTRGRKVSRPGIKNGVVEVQTWNEIDESGEYTGHVEQRERYAPPPERRCNAIIGNLEWAGNRCVKYAVRGANVCGSHGGSLPEVKRAAQQRLAMAADRASAQLIHIALTKRGVADKDRIKALTEILDRAGVQGKQTIEVEIKPWQQMLQRIQGQIEGAGSTIEAIEGVDYFVPEEGPTVDDEE